jgi:hypothetical protein
MKLKELFEMTMKVNSFEGLAAFLPEYAKLKETGKHVGDIEKIKIFSKLRSPYTGYCLFDGDKAIAYFVTVKSTKMLQNAFVIPEERKRGVFQTFLLFLKRHEGYDKITLGQLHSKDTIESLKRIYKQFDTYWEKGIEKVPYDPATIDQFYGDKPTGWKIVLENDYDFSSWPRFFPDFSDSLPPVDLCECFYFGFLEEE